MANPTDFERAQGRADEATDPEYRLADDPVLTNQYAECDRYGTDEHEAWLIEMEADDERWSSVYAGGSF